MIKGIKEQLENNPTNPIDKKFSLKALEDMLTERLAIQAKDTDRKVVMARGCLAHGYLVITNGVPDIPYCDNPKCGNCKMVKDMIDKSIENEIQKHKS